MHLSWQIELQISWVITFFISAKWMPGHLIGVPILIFDMNAYQEKLASVWVVNSFSSDLFTLVSMWETSLIIGISYLCITVAGFNLLQSPDEVVWGAEGKRFSFECKVDEAWQWCYWEITKLDGVSLQKIEQRHCDYILAKRGRHDYRKYISCIWWYTVFVQRKWRSNILVHSFLSPLPTTIQCWL